MKNVLVIFGSPHANGSTKALADACVSGVADAAVTWFNCFDTAPAPCDDCRFCHTATRCRHRDLDEFYEALEAADVLIFATPVYNRSFPAPMKAVIDRLQRYWAARFVHGVRPPIAKPKTTVLLTCAGAARDDGDYLAAQLAPALTVLNASPAVTVHAAATDSEPLSSDLIAAAKAAGEQAAI